MNLLGASLLPKGLVLGLLCLRVPRLGGFILSRLLATVQNMNRKADKKY